MKCPKCGGEVTKREINHHDCWGSYDGTTIFCKCVDKACGFEFKYDEE